MAKGDLGYVESKAPGAAAIMSQTIGILVGVTIIACWAATQYTASKLAYQTSLGDPLWRVGAFALYMPFDFFIWLLKFGHVEGTEAAFNGGEWIVTSLHLLFVPAIWNAFRLQKKAANVKSTLHGSARWAEREDIYTAGLMRRPQFGKANTGSTGCYVGAWIDPANGTYNYLTHDGPEHILAYAPTRSGKGVGLVLPTMLSWPHSALIFDIKGEAWALTSGYRKAIGQKVLKFMPTAMDGSSVRFNPLEEIRIGTMREVADAQNVAAMIVDPDGKGMEDHWAKTGHELLSAALIHILYTGPDGAKTLRGLVSFFCDPTSSIEQVANSMLNMEHDKLGKYGWRDPITNELTKTHPVVAESVRSFLNKSENERSGVQSTAMSFLSLYRDPVVAMNTAVSEFKIDDLMDSEMPVSLYLVVPPNDINRLRPLIRLVLNQIIRQRTEMMDFKEGRSVANYKHRMLLMLDEFPALGKLELMETSLAFIAGYGLKCYLITQDIAQLNKAYGKDESITSNAHIRIAFAPNKVETAEALSKYTGTATVVNATRSFSGNRLNPMLMHTMAAENLLGRSLLTADECLRLPGAVKSIDGKNITAPGDMLIMPAGAPPIYGKQILYFKDPIFDGRSKIRAPDESDRLHERTQIRRAPIACDPALASLVVIKKESELDGMVDGGGAPQIPTSSVVTGAVVSVIPAIAVIAAMTATSESTVEKQEALKAVEATELDAAEDLQDESDKSSDASAVEAAMRAEGQQTVPVAVAAATSISVTDEEPEGMTAEELALLDADESLVDIPKDDVLIRSSAPAPTAQGDSSSLLEFDV